MLALEALTVGELIKRSAARFRHCRAVWYEGDVWNYEQLDEITDDIAAALVGIGIGKGKHVGVFGEIEAETLFVFYALQKLGAVTVMINTSLEKEELLQAITMTDIEYLFVGASYKQDKNLCATCQEVSALTSLKEIISVGKSVPGTFRTLKMLMKAPALTRTDLFQMYAKVKPMDTAVILFTSGSTSKPKAVMSSHYSRVNSGIQQADDLRADCKDLFCVAMPMFHCFCISANLLAALSAGACLCIPQDRHTHSILKTVSTCGCTVLSCVPTMFYAMMGKKDFSSAAVKSLRTGIIGGAYYPPEEFVRIEKTLGFTLLSSLGQTECTAGITVCGMDDSLEVRSRTVGHFMSHVEGKIADLKTGMILPIGVQGEICVRGYVQMQGYYGREDLTQEVIDADGWLHTGDLGSMDNSGRITLAGRCKELIIRGGENISPCEIEAVLSLLPQVKDCKAVGVPDSHYGEEICVCISVNEGQTLDEKLVKEHISNHLAYYKIPRYVLFWDGFPCTCTQKIKTTETALKAKRELGL
ncbi:MAG: AMP-binding protein [Ruthenibacterium sp.]